ncbi:MAG: PQQ-dependent sugar dehydrogenase [Phycisphaerales bacterium]
MRRAGRHLLFSAGLAGAVSGALALALAPASSARADPPAGFVAEAVGSGWNELVGVAPLPDGRVIAWERAGRVWMVEADGTRHATPMLDISDEVLAWRDHGMLGLALDPDFEHNGHIYLAYAVDRHHLDFFGTAQYNPATTVTSAATIGRVTRYTADPDEGFEHCHAESRLVLLGITKEDGIPLFGESHGVGSLSFGEDGTLLLSAGDSADYTTVDTGGPMPTGFREDALASGILRPSEDVGAYRAQLRDCLNGKLLRLDPATGDGVASNPFFDPAHPRAPRSRVWAMGLRNPFRVSHVPGTGAHLPGDGDPGAFVVSDVGWGSWEEVSIVDAPGLDLGWPIHEGHERTTEYAWVSPQCTEAPNPLAGSGGCEPFLRFRDLLQQESLVTLDWIVPCAMRQAEDGTGTSAPPRSEPGGFLSWGYRALAASTGSSLQLWIPFNGGEQTLLVRYANGGADSSCTVRIDNAPVGTLALPATGSWTQWRLLAFPIGTQVAGWHQIQLAGIGAADPAGAPVAAAIDAMAPSVGGAYPEIPESSRRGLHRRPIVDWPHGSAGARTAGWSGDAAVARTVGTAGGATGEPFGGSCAIAAAPVALSSWPAQWRGRLWLADYADGWIRAATLEDGLVTHIEPFEQRPGGIVGIFPAADAESLFVVDVSGGLTRYRYAPGGNHAPVVRVTTSAPVGAAPLMVDFDASGSTDPDGDRLFFEWDFADGRGATQGSVVSAVFHGTGAPAVRTVRLTVTDGQGLGVSQEIPIWTDDEPPSVHILSPQDGQLYSMASNSTLPLRAQVDDPDHPGQVSCAWRAILHHNTHIHPEPEDPACETTAVISPLGCGTDTFWVELQFTATDPLGLSTQASVALYPDCEGVLGCRLDVDRDGQVGGADIGLLLGAWGATTPESWQLDLDANGQIDGADLGALLAAWGPCPR